MVESIITPGGACRAPIIIFPFQTARFLSFSELERQGFLATSRQKGDKNKILQGKEKVSVSICFQGPSAGQANNWKEGGVRNQAMFL